MKEIPLTQGYIALVDDSDFDYLNQFKWSAVCDTRKDGTVRTVYAYRNSPKHSGSPHHMIAMHRELMGVTDPKTHVDHEDHWGINNQRCNLRVCSGTQNNGNQRKQSAKTSKFKGVHWVSDTSRKRNKRWRAQLKIMSRCVHLGTFLTQEEAARAYDAAAITYFGEFALTNFSQ
jgi:hypothetical protein